MIYRAQSFRQFGTSEWTDDLQRQRHSADVPGIFSSIMDTSYADGNFVTVRSLRIQLFEGCSPRELYLPSLWSSTSSCQVHWYNTSTQ